MVRFFPVSVFARPRKAGVAVLAFAWICGMLCGALATIGADSSFHSLMRLAPSESVSIVGLLVSVLLPLFFSAAALYSSQYWFLAVFAFFRSFLFSYISVGLVAVYHSAAWLMSLLLLFSDWFCIPVLIWLWFHCFGNKDKLFRSCGILLIYVLVICYFDYQFVTPFLVRLLTM